jgi:hypothetical protein
VSHDHSGEHGAAHRHHGAAHQHRHEPADFGRAYVLGITLNFAFPGGARNMRPSIKRNGLT